MKQLFFILVLSFLSAGASYAQTSTGSTLNEWSIQNVGTVTGERVIAMINVENTGLYLGASIVGEIVDAMGNWGNSMPIVASFRLYAQFSSSRSFQLIQDIVTPSITLRLKTISPTQMALVGNCAAQHRQIKVLFRTASTLGTRVTMGDPNVLTTVGTLIAEPTYITNLQKLTINADNLNTNGYALAVGGKAVAESMTVKIKSAWPDYVFAQDYSLPQLAEVKKYVVSNSKLPDFPSEKDIRDKGLDLGEMNRLLTKKVEELFLYLIQKDVREKEQEAINQQLLQSVKAMQSELTEIKSKIKKD